MPLIPTRPDDEGTGRGPGSLYDETTQVVRDFQRNLNRVLGFLGYTIHDIVNDPRKKEHVKRAYRIARRIDRDLEEEARRPRRLYDKATARLAEYLRRRVAEGEGE